MHCFENDEESIFNGTDLLSSIEHSTVCVAGKWMAIVSTMCTVVHIIYWLIHLRKISVYIKPVHEEQVRSGVFILIVSQFSFVN